MTHPPPAPPDTPSTFQRTLVRVMAVQAIALVFLWLLQVRYTD